MLGSCGPGKLTENGKIPKVLRGGCKRSFGPREQRSPKSLLHHPKPLLHRCKMGFGWCKRLFGHLCFLGPKDLLHPPLSTFGIFPFSVNFSGPQLPNLSVKSPASFCPRIPEFPGPKVGEKRPQIGQNQLKSARNRLKIGQKLAKIG